ncbi:hypothetical protein B6V67_25075 [Escherichia coli]|nr:hypothetical protein [Escherichia coli]
MCELDILHDSLYQFCPELHLKRLNSLTLACHALLDCKTLTLTELGRALLQIVGGDKLIIPFC